MKGGDSLYSSVNTAMLHGIRAVAVCVEADVSDGMPVFDMVGYLASEVREARERVRTALRNAGYELPPKRVTVNFAPADIRKSGSGFDLPIALSVAGALGIIPKGALDGVFVTGEIGLNGRLQPVRGVLPMVADARERGFSRCIVPEGNLSEAGMVSGISVFAAGDVGGVIRRLAAGGGWEESPRPPMDAEGEEPGYGVDFSDVAGQRLAKRACEVAVSGMHNLLLIGPPGAGKTMIATRIPTILPGLCADERLELSKIYSVAGLLPEGGRLMGERPFRAPHHTVTAQGLSGGGMIPRPGEISLAHKGVLFLDELPEFRKDAIEALRQPLEEKRVRLARSGGTYEYPADFMLVAAMNPCKCGYYPDMQRCSCTPASISRYLGRISQPLLDRMDIFVEARQARFSDLDGASGEEPSSAIRARVERAQAIQRERYRGEDFSYNSQIPAVKMKGYCALGSEQRDYMEGEYKRLSLTARAYHRILKVARTIADMDGADEIGMAHLREASCYRGFDRSYWDPAKRGW